MKTSIAGRFGRSISFVCFLVGLYAVIPAPWQSAEAKPVPPLTMTAAFDRAQPELKRDEVLRVKLETTEDYEKLVVKVDLPSEIALISGQTEWQGALRVDEPQEIVLKVMLTREGRYSVTVDSFFDAAESSFESARIHLNVIADKREIRASTEPFQLMDMQRIRSMGLGDGLALDSYEIPNPTPAEAPAVVPMFLKPVDDADKPDASLAPEGLQPRSTTIVVSGKAQYYDTADNMHPVRWAKVEVLNVKGGANTVIGRGYTGTDGAYSIRAVSSVTAPDVKVHIYSEIMNNQVAAVGPNRTDIYYMASNIRSNYTGTTLAISVATGKPVSGSASDSASARTFSVLDAVLQGAADSYALRGNNLMPIVRVVYPHTGSFYRPSESAIYLLRFDALDWDVILHEYGHFLADKGSSSNFDNSPGGAHAGGSTIPLHGKDKGVRLAWSEGFATWFAIMSQIRPTQNLLSLPGVPNSGNRFYQDTEDANLTDDLESPLRSQGYSSGNSLHGLLYDLCDNVVDQSPTGRSRDYINVPPKYVWDILNSGDWDNVGKFYNRICNIIGINDIPNMFRVAEVFALNNIAPELQSPDEGDIVSSSISPEFSWLANGDTTPGYEHNNFTLIIANNNFTQLLAFKTGIRDTKHSFTSDEWQAIVDRSDDTGTFQWAVIGYNDRTPRMPPAGPLNGFLSNMHNFKVRAYHIRLRWATEGADIDLHLRPPSGASYAGWRYPNDCAYYNRNPDWGVPGDSRDNPYLDRDCIRVGTEENITLDIVTDPGTYKVLVHYYRDHNVTSGDDPGGPVGVRVDIYRYGKLLGWSQNVLRNPDNHPDSGDIWVPFTFTVGRSGVTFMDYTPDNVTRSLSYEDDGLGLPDEFFEKH